MRNQLDAAASLGEGAPTWLVCTALPAELAPIRRRLLRRAKQAQVPVSRDREGKITILWNRQRFVLTTLGLRAARLVPLKRFVEQERAALRGMLLLGLAGGLAASWRAGELAVARCVVEQPAVSATGPVEQPQTQPNKTRGANAPRTEWAASAEMLALAQRAAAYATLKVREAHVLTHHEQVVATPAAKAALEQASGCELVEMEAARFVALAEAAEVPWMCVRAVLDTAHEKLPSLERLAEARGLRLLAELARLAGSSPRSFLALPRLGVRSSSCGRKLARFAEAVIATHATANDPLSP